ncbi:Uncharacterised protein [Mycobacteroides abscessus subsp. abscessus]|nr:Uncharacterised protein [Mycobacteroides abscessus subsp. abscessus]
MNRGRRIRRINSGCPCASTVGAAMPYPITLTNKGSGTPAARRMVSETACSAGGASRPPRPTGKCTQARPAS